MQQTEIQSKVNSYKIGVGHMQENMPAMVDAYHHFTGACFGPGALEEKQKQLIALGISLFANNEVCTLYHVQEALSLGASKQEIVETTAVAAAVGSGHTLSQGVTRVQQALDSLTRGTQ
ncbi:MULTISPECIES: carboxymuconolactone decarboxylase family protein [unclassified Paenibacillus]|uniref:carboxymuconolactone decarboxylase family protein n=1 Tax=unclassified Paenibacillus TaxID=185978 RepID=UPI001AE1C41F|nr:MULTISPECIES: carboxymuconolactone decarboxylase family protein [unclassified Paenibacillus]MBP1155153.1 AhpD family alkylhydroperoxidase [Paenibacillus sp. PvP091]MBP1169463.1 AhpD family alkylhydroperoxidase [Paenibacillus sp. PvR098]MBP2440491.1 AhpD family alkylhydroperoxidase [Paenibacillus sp. PvP052]